jgi:hypothetical protein
VNGTTNHCHRDHDRGHRSHAKQAGHDSADVNRRSTAPLRTLQSIVLARLLMLVFAIALIGGTVTAQPLDVPADAPAVQVEDLAVDIAAPPPTFVLAPVGRIVAPPPPAVTDREGRLYVATLLRPPRVAAL